MYGVEKYLDISTAHIPPHLLNGECDCKIGNYPEGAFFYVPYMEDGEFIDEVPKELVEIFKYAFENECVIIRFDRDGMEFKEFPVYYYE
jgi:hypothetical protein